MSTPIDAPLERKSRRWSVPGWSGALVALIVLGIFTAIKQPTFTKPTNLVNILDQQALVGIVAVGMTLVMILGGIDLSVGSLLALAGGVGILTLNKLEPRGDTLAVLAAASLTLAIGLLAGLVNGLLIAKGRIAPFIATLGALVSFRSVARWQANGGQFFAQSSALFSKLGQGIAIPGTNVSRLPSRHVPMYLPYAVIVWPVVVVAAAILLNRTRLGRHIVAVGSNERAARYSAVAVDRVKIVTYSLLGLLVGVAALLNAGKYQSVNSGNAGELMELDAIAAVVIGGTRMEGGSGSVFGTVVGVLLLGVIRNMMVMLGINSHVQGLVMGLIIIAAVLVQRIGRK